MRLNKLYTNKIIKYTAYITEEDCEGYIQLVYGQGEELLFLNKEHDVATWFNSKKEIEDALSEHKETVDILDIEFYEKIEYTEIEIKKCSEKSKNNKLINIVHGIDMHSNNGLSNQPWIHSIYADGYKAFNVMTDLEDSKDYGHMMWFCSTLALKGSDENAK